MNKTENIITYIPTGAENKILMSVAEEEHFINEIAEVLKENKRPSTIDDLKKAIQTKGEYIREEAINEAIRYTQGAPSFVVDRATEDAANSVDEELIEAIRSLCSQWSNILPLEDFKLNNEGKYAYPQDKIKALIEEKRITLTAEESAEARKLQSFIKTYKELEDSYGIRNLLQATAFNDVDDITTFANIMLNRKEMQEIRESLANR